MIDVDFDEPPPPRRPLLRRKRVLIPLGVVLAIIAGFLLLLTPDTDRDAMIAKYGGPNATFAAGPAGQRIHYRDQGRADRSEEHQSELQSLMRTSYAVLCLKKKKTTLSTH